MSYLQKTISVILSNIEIFNKENDFKEMYVSNLKNCSNPENNHRINTEGTKTNQKSKWQIKQEIL